MSFAATVKPRRAGRQCVALGVLSIVGLIGDNAASRSCLAAQRADALLAWVSVDVGARQGLIPRDFDGISTDFPAVRAYLGASPRASNRVVWQLLANLGPGSLRLGGDTQDTSCWKTIPVGRRGACGFRFGPALPRVVFAAANRARWSVIMGLNLALDNPGAALTFVRNGVVPTARPGTLSGLEIGNEPDFYSRIGFRPPSYSFAQYVREFQRYLAALKGDSRTRGLPILGPAFFTDTWYRDLGPFIARVGARRLAYTTLHYYPLSECGAWNRANATIPHLLSENTITAMVRQISRAVIVARAYGQTVRMDEMNSVSCHGKPGVSDTFASALWGLDTMFSLARAGVRGVNFHMYDPGVAPGYYNPIVSAATRSKSGAWTYRTQVRPLYYAMLFFTGVTGCRFLPARLTESRANVKAYAVSNGSRVRIYLLNKDLTRSGTILISPSRAPGTAEITVMRAPHLSSVDGTTMGGRAVDLQTGRLGHPRVTLLAPDPATGTYRVSVPVASAVMVSLRLTASTRNAT